MTIKDVAHHLGVGWDTIKDIQKRDLPRRYGKPKLKHLRHIAIDEIASAGASLPDRGPRPGERRGRLRRRRKRGGCAEAFWKRLRPAGRIEAVATDMSPAYLAAVRDHLPKAMLVFDRFHVVKLFNDKLSHCAGSCTARRPREHKAVLKGTRWLLLKNPENLDEERDERKRLEKALKLNKPLATAYYMKEDLRQIWDQREALRQLPRRLDRPGGGSGIRILQKLAETWRNTDAASWRTTTDITTGPLEGTNNKIKTMQRQAYGFRDQEFFKLKLEPRMDANGGNDRLRVRENHF